MKSLTQGKFTRFYYRLYSPQLRPVTATAKTSAAPFSTQILRLILRKANSQFTRGLCLVILFLSTTVCADLKVGIVLSGNNPVYDRLASSITESLHAHAPEPVQVSRYTLTKQDTALPESLSRATMLITVGTSATDFALASRSPAKIISTFITRNATGKILAQHQAGAELTNARFVGGVYLDQPAERLLRLARLINPKVSHIGMLTGTLSSSRTSEFQTQAKALSMSINTQQLEPQDNPVKILEPIMSESQAYIVLPDKADFNRTTARWIIYLSYRHAVPVIGYSNRYIDAGALASIFSTPEQIGEQTAELALQQFSVPAISPQFEFPKYYVVRINDKVKRSLGYNQLNEPELSRALEDFENPQATKIPPGGL